MPQHALLQVHYRHYKHEFPAVVACLTVLTAQANRTGDDTPNIAHR